MKRQHVQYFRETVRSLYNALMDLHNTQRAFTAQIGPAIDNVDAILRFVLSSNGGNEKLCAVKEFIQKELPLLEAFKRNISRKVRQGLMKYHTECISFMKQAENSKEDVQKLTFSDECLRTIDTVLVDMAKKYELDKDKSFGDIMLQAKTFAVIARFDHQHKVMKEYAEELEERIPLGTYGSNDNFTVKTRRKVPIALPAKNGASTPIALADRMNLSPRDDVNSGGGFAIAAVTLNKSKVQMMKTMQRSLAQKSVAPKPANV